MMHGRDFLVFSDDWGRHPFSCQHLMEQFRPHNRLLWVHTIGLRTPQLTVYDCMRSLEKIRSWCSGSGDEALRLPDNLRIVSPVMLPFNRVPAVRAFNRRSVVRRVRQAMRDWGMRTPVLVATVPNATDYLGAFGEALAVYYCVDDFSLWPGMNQADLVRLMEQDLLTKADLIVTTAEELQRTRLGKNPTRLLTHGVDVAHFSRPPAVEKPEPLRGLSGPLIGFFGLLDGRLDLSLVQAVLAARPDWTLVFIGKTMIALDALKRYRNFMHLPPVDYGALPDYAACFDVAVIPYLVNEHTASVNPLKLREYIATGKPVVATPLTEARRLAPPIRLGNDPDSFIAAIEASLADTTRPEERRAALRGETWTDKAEQFAAWIEEALAAQNLPAGEQP